MEQHSRYVSGGGGGGGGDGSYGDVPGSYGDLVANNHLVVS